jgi:hypothetical protein
MRAAEMSKLLEIIGTDKAFGDLPYLRCPECGFEYVHLTRVKVATGDGVTIIENGETRHVQRETAEVHEARSNRGVRIFIEYACEEAHHGAIILQFHKGVTFVEHESLPEIKDWKEIWRS